MIQEELFTPVESTKFDFLSKSEVVSLFQESESVIRKLQKENDRLRDLLSGIGRQKSLFVDEQYILIKNRLFGRSSEREAIGQPSISPRYRRPEKKVQCPSQRYPNVPVIEQDITLDKLPECPCCSGEMKDSGMTEDSEQLTVIPRQYFIIHQKRHKYICSHCHGSIKTAPSPPRIKPRSSYSDEMVLDVALSKYCDLIPIERYSSMAGRGGVQGLPPQSLIELTHHLSDFVKGAYEKLREEIRGSKILQVDETPHKMLERGGGKSWYLWGFSNKETSYFEIHNTRSGDVSSELLKSSCCEHLVSDVFSGYHKAVKEVNEDRQDKNLPLIRNVYCNAHSRRKFKEAVIVGQGKVVDEARSFVDIYRKIYRLEQMAKDREPKKVLRLRKLMDSLFEQMKTRAMRNIGAYSSKSSMGKAMSYFLRNYEGLTLFLSHPGLPIDNNSQERQLRSPVVGRKTWYGTHSKRGAETAAVLFSLVESCKLNQVNPRNYFKKLVESLHLGKKLYSPREFKQLNKN